MKSYGWKHLVEGNHRNLLIQILEGMTTGLAIRLENEHVCELLMLANRYAVECLKNYLINFIMMHAKEVI